MNSILSSRIINTTFLALQALLILAFALKKQYFSVIGTALTFVLFLIFLFFEHKKGSLVTDFIRISVLVTVLANSFIGEYLGFYYTSVYFDKALHVFGTFSFTLFIFFIADKQGHFPMLGRGFLFIYILLLGSFVGTMFEVGEFICDVIFKTVNQNGLVDTNVDMIGNTLGAIIAGFFVIRKKCPHQKPY